MAALDGDQIRILEQIRQRLQTLNASHSSLLTNLYNVHPLPAWSELQAYLGLISDNLQAITKLLADNQQLLSSVVVYPLPQFPSTQAHLLEHLLRTRLEPEVEEWVEKGLELAQQNKEGGYPRLAESERDQLWQWAPVAANDEIRKQNWGGDYTMAEKHSGFENVHTGLRRVLQEPLDTEEQDEGDAADESEEDDDEEGDVEVPRVPHTSRPGQDVTMMSRSPAQMRLDDILRFMSTGNLAPGKPP